MSSPLAAAIFWRWSISSTVASRSRSEAASSKRVASDASSMRARSPRPGRRGGPPETGARRSPRRVRFVGGEPLHARAQAAVDVVLQARLGMVAGEVDLAGRDQEMAVNEVNQTVRQVAGKERAEVGRSVLAQPPG